MGQRAAVKNDHGLQIQTSRCEPRQDGEDVADEGAGAGPECGHTAARGGGLGLDGPPFSQHPVPEAAGDPWNSRLSGTQREGGEAAASITSAAQGGKPHEK